MEGTVCSLVSEIRYARSPPICSFIVQSSKHIANPSTAELEEVEDPPETPWIGVHSETPHALRLMSDYIKKNPQVWQTSTTPADATRPDDEGYLAKMLSR